MNTKCTTMNTQRGHFRFKSMKNEAKGLCGILVFYVHCSVTFALMGGGRGKLLRASRFKGAHNAYASMSGGLRTVN